MIKQKLDTGKYKSVWKGRTKTIKIELLIGNDYPEDIMKPEIIEIANGFI